MQIVYSLGIGYLLGCISPAKAVSRRKKVDLKEAGTTNLGATNTALVLGMRSGFVVMLLDILKAVCSYRLAKLLFPRLAAAGLVAGFGCVVGHCFPVTNRFRGGKGLAAYGGMVLAFSPKIFLILASLGAVMVALLNTGVAMPITAGMLLPVMVYYKSGSICQTFTALAASIFLIGMHWGNLKKALAKEDYITTREFFRKFLGRNKT